VLVARADHAHRGSWDRRPKTHSVPSVATVAIAGEAVVLVVVVVVVGVVVFSVGAQPSTDRPAAAVDGLNAVS
jgi:hypothetical protein